MDKQEQWNSLSEQVSSHSWPFNNGSRLSGYNLFMSCYLQLASFGRESIPEPSNSPVSIPEMRLKLAGIPDGFHWTNKERLRTKVMSKDNTISEQFE